jgi:hypothetical protein
VWLPQADNRSSGSMKLCSKWLQATFTAWIKAGGFNRQVREGNFPDLLLL